MLSVKPIRSMNQKAGIADSGMAIAEISVARQSRRNRKTTSDREHRAFDQRLASRDSYCVLGIFDRVEELGEVDPRILASRASRSSLHGRVIDGDVGRALGPLDR